MVSHPTLETWRKKKLMEQYNEVSMGNETISPPPEEESISRTSITTTTNQNAPSFILITDEEINKLKTFWSMNWRSAASLMEGENLRSNTSSKRQQNKESVLWLSPQATQFPTHTTFLLELTGNLCNHQEKSTIQQVEFFTSPLKIQKQGNSRPKNKKMTSIATVQSSLV